MSDDTPDPHPWFSATSWITSPESDQVLPAFVRALWAVEDIVKRNKVEAGPIRYTYADLGAVFDEIKPKLRAEGLALTQTPTVDYGVTTSLIHESGQWIRFAPLLIRPSGATPQNFGSAITYARRYSAQSVMGLATEDDDGRSASVAAEDPVGGRVDTVIRRLGALADAGKAEMRKFADTEGKSLAGNALYKDTEWLQQVEAMLDVLDDT